MTQPIAGFMYPVAQRVRVRRANNSDHPFVWLIEEASSGRVLHLSPVTFRSLETAFQAGTVAMAASSASSS